MKALVQNTLIQNRYLVVQLIGKGGMGEVYLAVDQRLGSAIALKRTFFAGDEILANAFEREAKTLARMRHPVLPKVSDHFGEGDEQYLVMEHISGDDLAKRIEIAQKPFPVSWVLFWADQLLDALSYLHSHEPPIIHRDIKPQNLKLTDENHIILLDFGLSKTSTGQTNVNQSGGSTGSVVGYTPHYAPMEQIRGIGTSARSDLYSLSATLYQLLTDTVPSDALSRADSMLNGLPDPIQPIFEINPEISKNVSDVILKGMEVSQDRRYANAREMQKILRKAFAEMQQGVTADTAVQDRPTTSIEQSLSSSFAQTEVLNAGQSGELGSASSSPVFGGFSGNSVGSETDFDATIAYDPGSEVVSPKQADVKTEVFLAGSVPFPLSPDQDSTSLNGPPQPGQNSSLSGLSATNDFSSGFDSGPKGYTPDATAPYLPVQGDDANGFPDEGLGTPDYYGNSTSQPGAFQTVSTPYFDTPVPEIEPEPEVSSPSRDAVVSLPAKKKSSSKVFAVVGGLSALLILGTFAALGGWYYLSNYNAAQTVAEPTPSPEMSIEASPSPEPTLETVFDSNSLGNSNSDPTAETNTNSDVGGDEFTVAPTPAPVITGPATRSTPQTATRSTPPTTVRNNAPRPVPPAAKATPKPKPKSADDRTKILQ